MEKGDGNMRESPLTTNECPSSEQLSAYFDKESKLHECIEAHLKNCKKCKAYIDTLSRIDYSVKHAVFQETGSDEEISKRILSRVNDTLKKENVSRGRRFFLSPVQWRAASLLFLAGILGYLLWEEQHPAAEEPYIPNRIQASAETKAVFTEYNPLQISELQNVNFSSDQTVTISGASSYQTIEKEVRHVWGMGSATEAELRALMKKNQIPAAALQATEKGWKFSHQGNKLQIVNFVNDCAEAGFRLLSPAQPQPEQKSFAGKASDPVLYHGFFAK